MPAVDHHDKDCERVVSDREAGGGEVGFWTFTQHLNNKPIGRYISATSPLEARCESSNRNRSQPFAVCAPKLFLLSLRLFAEDYDGCWIFVIVQQNRGGKLVKQADLIGLRVARL